MPELGWVGVVRGTQWKTTFEGPEVGQRPADLVDRKFIALVPNRLSVADLTTSAPGQVPAKPASSL